MFPKYIDIWKHTQKEHVKEEKKCELCNYKTIVSRNLKDHVKYTHNMKLEMIECVECHKTVRKDLYQSHMKQVHTHPTAFKCELCNKGFSSSGNLKTHKLFHEGLKQFPCKKCDKSFYTAQSRKTHTKSVHMKVI